MKKHCLKLLSGINPKQAERGIKKTMKSTKTAYIKQQNMYVKFAERSLQLQRILERVFAQIIVNQLTGENQELITLKQNVNTAKENSLQTNTRLQSTVKSIGIESVEFDGIEDVYNMEVEDNHNFAVNGGLIVHNCMDNIRYFVATTGLAKEKTQYQAIL